MDQVMPTEDALADAETLRLYLDGLIGTPGRPDGWSRCSVALADAAIWGESTLYWTQRTDAPEGISAQRGRMAAHAALRAVPELRGEAPALAPAHEDAIEKITHLDADSLAWLAKGCRDQGDSRFAAVLGDLAALREPFREQAVSR